MRIDVRAEKSMDEDENASGYDRFRRIYSAIVTPGNTDAVDEQSLEELVQKEISAGVEGIYCCGSSGEGPILTEDARNTVVDIVVEKSSGQVPVITNVGSVSTLQSIRLAQHAENAGADAVSLYPPYYYSFNEREIYDHYHSVMDSISLPVVIYNIPQFTGVEMTHQSSSRLLSDDQVLGMKHTSHNMYELERMTAEHPDKVFFNGFDEIYASALAAGATATIGTTVNFQAGLFHEVREAFTAGQVGVARSVQRRINDVVERLVSLGVFSAAKALTGRIFGFDGRIRPPFRSIKPGEPKLTELERLVADGPER